jgi:fibronectin type 3 domain-containing protein
VKVSNEFRYCFTDEEGKFVVANVKLFFWSAERGYITKFEPAAVNRDKPTNLFWAKVVNYEQGTYSTCIGFSFW